MDMPVSYSCSQGRSFSTAFRICSSAHLRRHRNQPAHLCMPPVFIPCLFQPFSTTVNSPQVPPPSSLNSHCLLSPFVLLCQSLSSHRNPAHPTERPISKRIRKPDSGALSLKMLYDFKEMSQPFWALFLHLWNRNNNHISIKRKGEHRAYTVCL